VSLSLVYIVGWLICEVLNVVHLVVVVEKMSYNLNFFTPGFYTKPADTKVPWICCSVGNLYWNAVNTTGWSYPCFRHNSDLSFSFLFNLYLHAAVLTCSCWNDWCRYVVGWSLVCRMDVLWQNGWTDQVGIWCRGQPRLMSYWCIRLLSETLRIE